ncbi:MAG TPA: MFS transporter [Thermoanaerobaculia bacterium]|nr:MFS transporter [Thermoanaerobaculia bacterium]
MDLRRKLYWITLLYFAEGFPFGIAYKVWPVYFRLHGVSLADIGLMSLLFLPYTIKAAWAPFVDRYGTRQIWITTAELALAGITVALLVLDPSSTHWILWVVLLAFTLASATQDIAIDGYAVDVATPADSGPINGARVASYRAALLASGGLMLILADDLPWRVLWVGVAVLFVAMAVVTFVSPRVARERPTARMTQANEFWTARAVLLVLAAALLYTAYRKEWGALWITLAVVAGTLFVASFLDATVLRWALRAEMVPVLLFGLLYKLGDNSMGRMIEPFWVDKGLSPKEIGWISSTLGVALTITGALLGGWYIKRRGIFRALLWFGVAQLVSNFGYVAVAAFERLPRESIYGASVVESFTQGLGTAAFLSFLMNLCDREHAATQFALLTATFSLGRDVAGAFSGIGAERLGYDIYFLITALLALPGLLLLPAVRRRIREEGETLAPAEAAA